MQSEIILVLEINHSEWHHFEFIRAYVTVGACKFETSLEELAI